jgi:hypothetical protein
VPDGGREARTGGASKGRGKERRPNRRLGPVLLTNRATARRSILTTRAAIALNSAYTLAT